MVQRVRGEEQQGPSAANQGAAENAVALPPFKKHASRQKRQRDEERQSNLACRPQLAKLIDSKQRKSQHKDRDAKLVQPIRAQSLFQRKYRLHSLLSSWF